MTTALERLDALVHTHADEALGLDLKTLARTLRSYQEVGAGTDPRLLGAELPNLVEGLERIVAMLGVGMESLALDASRDRLAALARGMHARARDHLDAMAQDLAIDTTMAARFADPDAPEIDVSQVFATFPSPSNVADRKLALVTVEEGNRPTKGSIEGSYSVGFLNTSHPQSPAFMPG